MRIRVNSGRRSGITLGEKFAGVFLIIFGLMFVFSVIFMSVAPKFDEELLPDGVEKYDAVVIEVIDVEGDIVWKEGSDGDYGHTQVYTSNVMMQYEINGEIYSAKYTFKELSRPVEEGREYKVHVNPEQPTKIYGYSTVMGEDVKGILTVVVIGFGVVGGIIALIGVIVLVKANKKSKMVNQQSMDNNYDNTSYDSQYYDMNNGYNGQNYSNQENTNQSYDTYEVNNYNYDSSENTDYSGTSLRD